MRSAKNPTAKPVSAKLLPAPSDGSPIAAADARSRSRQQADNYLVAADAPSTVRAYTTDGSVAVFCGSPGRGIIGARLMLCGADVVQGKTFKGRQFTAEVILWSVRWYLMFPISYRDLELMLLDRGVAVDHTTIFRWIQA